VVLRHQNDRHTWKGRHEAYDGVLRSAAVFDDFTLYHDNGKGDALFPDNSAVNLHDMTLLIS
jgi:hypothetical protein